MFDCYNLIIEIEKKATVYVFWVCACTVRRLLGISHLVCELHLAEPPPEPGLPGGAAVEAAPVVDADDGVALTGQQVRPQLPQTLGEKM